MRKKPWANDMIASRSDVVVSNPEDMKGEWRQLGFDTVIVEIGSGKGDYWREMAHKYPNELWIGIEKDNNAAGIALKKSIDKTSNNMKFIVGDACDIALWFEENEVDRIHLNFSDPWPKKHHGKRRLTSEKFLVDYTNILKKDGLIVQKTDNNKLFEYSLVSLSNSNYKLEEVYLNYRETIHDEDAITEYENNFMNKGQPIYRSVWRVNK